MSSAGCPVTFFVALRQRPGWRSSISSHFPSIHLSRACWDLFTRSFFRLVLWVLHGKNKKQKSPWVKSKKKPSPKPENEEAFQWSIAKIKNLAENSESDKSCWIIQSLLLKDDSKDDFNLPVTVLIIFWKYHSLNRLWYSSDCILAMNCGHFYFPGHFTMLDFRF